MCLGIPMRLIAVDGHTGTVETGGVRRAVRLDLTPKVSVGEYVIVHAGYAIQTLDEQAATETLALLAEAGFES